MHYRKTYKGRIDYTELPNDLEDIQRDKKEFLIDRFISALLRFPRSEFNPLRLSRLDTLKKELDAS